MKRWPPLVLIAALLVAALVLGREGSDRADDAARPLDPATLLPVAAPVDALDGTWFCAGQSAGDDTPADGTLVIANAGDTDASGTLEVAAAGGDEPVTEAIEVPARTTERVRLADLVEADWVAAQVQVEGGTVVVEHEVVGEQGRDAAPCHSRAADSWWLAGGASTRDAAFTLAIYNPYAGEARVDLAFTTEEGVREPSALQGLAVAPGAVVAVDVAAVVTERPVMATSASATRGQVVVDRIQTFDGEGAATTDEEAEAETYARQGLTVTPAVPGPRRTWSFPVGARAPFLHEQVILFNPRDEVAEVEIEVALDDPDRNGSLEPFGVTVPPGRLAIFDVDDIDAIPDDVNHSLTVRSENGVPVVAERTLDAGDEEEAPAYVGTAASTGSPVAAERWVFATGPDPEVERGRIVVVNPGDEALEVEVATFGDGEISPAGTDTAGEPLPTFTLGPGERRDVAVDDLDDDARSLSVVATGPVVAERRLVPVGAADPDEPGLGISAALGVPLRPGLVLLD